MSKYRDLDSGDIFPASWTDALQEFISSFSSNVRIEKTAAASIRVPAGSGSDQVAIGIAGLWRYRSTNATASVPGSTPGVYDIFATATANSFSNTPDPDTDTTDYNFALSVLATGATPGGGVSYRKIGELTFSGTTITEIRNQLYQGTALHAALHNPGGSDALDWAAIADVLDLAASDLSNGTTGTGAVVLAGDPTLTGTTTVSTLAATTLSGTPNFSGAATGQTAAADTNTTQLATTAFVIGQGYLKSATAAATYAPLASPAFTGTPTAPTAAADTTTTQLATTAFVIGQLSSANPVMNGTAAAGSSSKGSKADHVHPSDTSRAPLASPTFTGTPSGPTAAVDTTTTQLATTAYVVGQGYLKSSVASSTYAPLASPTFTGQVSVPLGSAAAPGLAFSGDSDTGIYQAAASANSLSVALQGTIAATFQTGGHLNILGQYRIGGVQIAASDLSNGVTGTGANALAGSPALTGTPTAPTAAVDTNTTQLATTAYVIGQGYAKLAGPTFTGTATFANLTATGNVALVTGGSGTLGFFGVTPVTRQGATIDLKDALTNYGLIQGTSASPLNLDGGALSAGSAAISGTLTTTGNVGFNGQAAAARPTYTVTNPTTDRTFNADSTSVDELADVLATVVADLKTIGLFQ